MSCCRSEVKNESIIVTTDRTESGGEKTDQKTIKGKIDALQKFWNVIKMRRKQKISKYFLTLIIHGEVKNIMTRGINSKYIKGQRSN